MHIKLKDLLNYKNKRVVARYKIDFPNATMQAEEAFRELMKYIWLCKTHKVDILSNPKNTELKFSCVMHKEMIDIDNMWHTFILHTLDYKKFCDKYLNGHYFHHEPAPITNKKISVKKYETELHRYLSYISDHLGTDTLMKWFKISSDEC